MRTRIFLVAGLLSTGSASAAILSENFDEPGGLFGGTGYNYVPSEPSGNWLVINNSSPIGQNSWFDGPAPFRSTFAPQSGAHFAAVDAASGSGLADLSNWLISPQITFHTGDQLSFYTRTVDVPEFADRLQVWLSTSGASTDVGNTSTSVGDFSTLLVDINPNYDLTGQGSFPHSWTQFTVALPASASGRIGFRYFVEGGGPGGDNSDFVGLDTVTVIGSAFVSQWNISTGGSWNNATNWSNGIPNAPAARVNFLSTPTGLASPGIITLDGSFTLGKLTFDNTNNHTISPGTGGTLTFDDTGDSGGVLPAITVNSGNHVITAPLAMTSGLTITTAAASSLNIGGNITGSGDVTINGAGSVTLGGSIPITSALFANGAVHLTGNTGTAAHTQTLAALSVASGVTVYLAPSTYAFTPATLAPAALSLADPTSKIDIGNNILIAPGTAATALGLINAGQVVSASGAANLGYITLDATNFEIRWTLLGDTNLDGKVNVSDFGNLATNFGSTSATWIQGDFDRNGTVNVADLGDLATNFGQQLTAGSATATSASTTAVPEPAALSLLGISALALRRRRRRISVL